MDAVVEPGAAESSPRHTGPFRLPRVGRRADTVRGERLHPRADVQEGASGSEAPAGETACIRCPWELQAATQLMRVPVLSNHRRALNRPAPRCEANSEGHGGQESRRLAMYPELEMRASENSHQPPSKSWVSNLWPRAPVRGSTGLRKDMPQRVPLCPLRWFSRLVEKWHRTPEPFSADRSFPGGMGGHPPP